MVITVFYRIENLAGKGENAGYQHFLLFQQGFQKPHAFFNTKTLNYVVKGLNLQT